MTPSAVASGIFAARCKATGNNGSGLTGSGKRAASSPITQVASKVMPATVAGSITVIEVALRLRLERLYLAAAPAKRDNAAACGQRRRDRINDSKLRERGRETSTV